MNPVFEWAGLFFPMTTVVNRAAYVRTVAGSEDPAAAEAMGVEVPAELPSDKEWSRWWVGENIRGESLPTNGKRPRWLAEDTCLRSRPLSAPPLLDFVLSHGHYMLTSSSGRCKSSAPRRRSSTSRPAPSPKHGHIFMHPWISRSPRWVRGKIARMLAGNQHAGSCAFEGDPGASRGGQGEHVEPPRNNQQATTVSR